MRSQRAVILGEQWFSLSFSLWLVSSTRERESVSRALEAEKKTNTKKGLQLPRLRDASRAYPQQEIASLSCRNDLYRSASATAAADLARLLLPLHILNLTVIFIFQGILQKGFGLTI